MTGQNNTIFLGRREEREERINWLADSRMHRESLKRRFVEPEGFRAADSVLRMHGTVFLDGNPGSGRKSAALMLLWSRFDDDGSCRRVAFDDDSNDGAEALDPNTVAEGDRLLLDLSEDHGPGGGTNLSSRLATFCQSVQEKGAAFVVVLPPGWQQTTALHEQRLAGVVKRLGRPSGEAVFRSHVQAEHSLDVVDRHTLPHLAACVADAPMRDIAELALRFVEVRRRDPHASVTDAFAEARKSAEDYVADVAASVGRYAPQQRALLLAAALFEGSHTDAVHEATRLMLEALSFSSEEIHLLEQDGIDTRLAAVDVAVDSHRCVRFGNVGYHYAVARYFWANHPDLRGPLRDWIGCCVESSMMATSDRERAVERFAGQACRHGRSEDLHILAARWAKSGDSGRANLRAAWAARALDHALRWDGDDGHVAQLARKQLYDWATKGADPGLARVMIEVSAKVVADQYPDQALVRLRWLACHEDRRVQIDAVEATRVLARDRRVYRRLLWRMSDRWIHQRRPSDVRLFLETSAADVIMRVAGSDIRALIQERGVRQQLVQCWSAVFALDDVSRWGEHVRGWLDTAADTTAGGVGVDVLVDAAGPEVRTMARLYVVARNWADAAPGVRGPVLERLYRGIAQAQGLDVA
ncbi:hypothetical protein BJF85_22195 [Saccharomonospora sp. CUA-673]|nr:hypothetical protein BJF85_22195 [Saccharomonospora sp. CUA-673]